MSKQIEVTLINGQINDLFNSPEIEKLNLILTNTDINEENFNGLKDDIIVIFKQIIQKSVNENLNKISLNLSESIIKCILMSLQDRDFSQFHFIRFGIGMGVTLIIEVNNDNLTLKDKHLFQKENTLILSLVRHGFSVANERRIFAGVIDYDLSIPGVKELEVYRDTKNYPFVQRYYCSPLLRAKRTFDILFGDKQEVYKYLDNFKEGNYGIYEDTPVGPQTKEFFQLWLDQVPIEGAENYNDFRNKIMNGLIQAYKETKQDGLNSFGIVAHAGILRIIVLELKSLSRYAWWDINVPNGLGYVFNIELKENQFFLHSMDII